MKRLHFSHTWVNTRFVLFPVQFEPIIRLQWALYFHTSHSITTQGLSHRTTCVHSHKKNKLRSLKDIPAHVIVSSQHRQQTQQLLQGNTFLVPLPKPVPPDLHHTDVFSYSHLVVFISSFLIFFTLKHGGYFFPKLPSVGTTHLFWLRVKCFGEGWLADNADLYTKTNKRANDIKYRQKPKTMNFYVLQSMIYIGHKNKCQLFSLTTAANHWRHGTNTTDG